MALLNSLGDKVSATDTEEILADFDENDSGSIQYNGKITTPELLSSLETSDHSLCPQLL